MKRISLYCFCVLLLLAAGAALAETQVLKPESWGLDRIDQRSGRNGTYTFDHTGANTIIYVVDLGVQPDLLELEGRIIERRELFDASTTPNDHGTQVASIAAGTRNGVAKRAAIIDVNYADSTPLSSDPRIKAEQKIERTQAVIEALNAIPGKHPAGWRGVVNYSGVIDLPTGADYATRVDTVQKQFDAAIRNLLANGFVVVAAATGHGEHACSYRPASLGTLDGVITVSAIEETDNRIQPGAGYGPCVDLFAPQKVPASSRFATSTTTNEADRFHDILFTDTSAAAPFVAGAAALILQQHPFLSPNEVEALLKANATRGVVTGNIGLSNNALLYTLLPPVAMSAPELRTGQSGSASIPAVSGATYAWSVINGTIVGSSSGPSVNFVAGWAGYVTATVTVTTPEGSATGHGLSRVRASTVQVSGSTTVNPGQSATLSLGFTGTGPWTVWWSDGVQQTFTTAQATRTVTPSQTTTYQVTMLRDGANCTGTTSGSATVNVCQSASATITAPGSAYASKTVTASVPATAGATYQWTVTNGQIWNGQGTNSLQVILGCSGNTTVSVTVTSSCGATSTSSLAIPIVVPVAMISGYSAIAAGETATIAATFYGTLPWAITWSDGVTQTSLITNTVYREVWPTTTTTYTATSVRDKYGCAATFSGSATVAVE